MIDKLVQWKEEDKYEKDSDWRCNYATANICMDNIIPLLTCFNIMVNGKEIWWPLQPARPQPGKYENPNIRKSQN